MTGSDSLLTTAQVAERINVHPGTLRWWRSVGKGPRSFTLGEHSVRYRAADVEAWVASRYAASGESEADR